MSFPLKLSGPDLRGRTAARSPTGRRSDADALVHFAAALSAHERRLRAEGAVVPATFVDLVNLLLECVRARHDATMLYEAVTNSHHVDVTERLLLTKREAADRLGVSVRTVERLVAADRLPLVHLEGASRIRVADLMAYVDGLGENTPPAHSTKPSITGRLEPPAQPNGQRRHTDKPSLPDGPEVL
jgi:excisionase family DNA binding protein